MLSDNHSLDNLFREKDKELPPGTHRMDAHWEQMQRLLLPAVPAPKNGRKWLPWAALLAIVAVTGSILLLSRGTNSNSAENAKPVAQQTTAQPVNNSPAPQKNNAEQPPATPAVVETAPTPQKQPVAKNTGTETTTAPAPVKKREYIELPQEPQVFHILADKDTLINCKHGTTIKIPAHSLADANGQTVTGEITMIVQEYYRYEDIIAAGLNRNAEMKKKSITAGMVKFDAYRDEQKLDVQPGRSIEISMRKDLINVPRKEAGDAPNNNKHVENVQDLNIHNLGWISYERFYKDTRPVTDLRIQVPKNIDVNKLISQLAFISVQGVMPGYIENNQVVFYNIPVGEKAWFISLGNTGSKFLSCVEEIEIKNGDMVTPVYKETSPEQFKKQLELLTSLPVKEQ